MYSSQLCTLASVAVLAGSVSAGAAVITAYTGEAATASTTATGSTSSALALGNAANSLVDVNFNDAAAPYATGVVYRFVPTNSGTVTNTAALAVANNRYYGFTVTADAGQELNLSSFAFLVGRGGASTPRGYDVRSSVDGYGATLGTADVTALRPSATPVSINLSGAAFQHLNSIQFRIYGYAPAVGSSLDLDSITVNGTVSAVPEPATLGFGLGLASLALLRPRRS